MIFLKFFLLPRIGSLDRPYFGISYVPCLQVLGSRRITVLQCAALFSYSDATNGRCTTRARHDRHGENRVSATGSVLVRGNANSEGRARSGDSNSGWSLREELDDDLLAFPAWSMTTSSALSTYTIIIICALNGKESDWSTPSEPKNRLK